MMYEVIKSRQGKFVNKITSWAAILGFQYFAMYNL